MASKHMANTSASDSTGLSILAQIPPPFHLNSALLASEIKLPPRCRIYCWVYKSHNISDPLHDLEMGRRRLLKENKCLPVTRSLLPSVYVGRGTEPSALYVFAIGSADPYEQQETFRSTLQLDGLVCLTAYAGPETYHFSPEGLYPCSAACSTQLEPCETCLMRGRGDVQPSSWASACLLPREPLRRPYAQFVHALRDRLIDDVAQASTTGKPGTTSHTAVRYKRGFLLSFSQATSDEWGARWDYHSRQRSLVYCEVRLYLYPHRILVHPTMHSAHLLPLSTAPSTSLSVGMPITLLPYGVPAYYLNTYSGPVGSLTDQFEVALAGLGAGDWQRSSSGPNVYRSPPGRKAYGTTSTSHTPTYVIAWLGVQNRHGEDKGMPIIWPLNLCVTSALASTHSRAPLRYIPMVPAQLLASPPVPAAKVPQGRSQTGALAPAFSSAEPTSPSPSSSSLHDSVPGVSSDRTMSVPREAAESMRTPRPLRPSLHRSARSDSIRAFRSLTIARQDARIVAGEVSTYVDAVAKEREKERERLKREREGGTVSRSVSATMKVLEKLPELGLADSAAKEPHREATLPRHEPESIMDFEPTPMEIEYPMVDTPEAASVQKAGTPNLSLENILPNIEPGPSRGGTEPVPHTIKNEDIISTIASQTNTVDSSAASFDPFFESNWNQQSGDFMSMPMDTYDIGIGFSMVMNGNGEAGNTGGAFNMDDGFGVFTDDDFNFFDSPATNSRVGAAVTSGLTPSASHATITHINAVAADSILTLGIDHPSVITQPQPIPWLHHALGDDLTPMSLGAPTPGVPVPPELSPSTPTQTPPSISAPVTPSVMLADQLHSIHIRRSSVSSAAFTSFDPIPFAQSHKMADGKYAQGKFALATPPPEDEETSQFMPLVSSGLHTPGPSWLLSYRTATDPRIGIVRRLTGAKRKRLVTDKEEREGRRPPFWSRQHEEWANEPLPEEPDSDADDAKSLSDIDPDEDTDEDRSRSVSLAHTPPPSFLPLGPDLIHTQFHHELLLPLSVPLRPPDTDPEVAIGTATLPMSAPTPVSPAAALGAPSERSKALEGAAQVLIREIVENAMWGDCWRASLLAMQGTNKNGNDVWMPDIRGANHLLDMIPGVESSLTVGRAFDADDIHELHAPSLTVGKADGVIQVLPPALRFWEKLGLHPRAGSKDITAYIFYEGSDDDKEAQIADCLDKFSAVYTSRNLGLHTAGRAPACIRDGLVPVQFDAFRKTLVSFVASLPDLEIPLVFYIITPTRMMNLASSALRQILSAMKKVRKQFPDAPILMHLLPDSLIQGALHDSTLPHAGLENIAHTVYDRVVLPTDRSMARRLLASGEKTRTLFSEPAFALAAPIHRKVAFSLEAHPSTLDVADRHYMLHVGYRASECGKWLFATCIDQRGEAHDLKAWLMPDDGLEHFIINSVWEFAMNMATKANVEWRIVISKLGPIGTTESQVWVSRLHLAMQETQHRPPMQVFLTTTEYEDPWLCLAPDHSAFHRNPLPHSRGTKHPLGVLFADTSSATYALQPRNPVRSFSAVDCTQEYAFVPDLEEENPPDELQICPLLTSALIRVSAGSDFVPTSMLRINLLHSTQSANAVDTTGDKATMEEITRNYFDLAVLARCRWKLDANPILPFHLAALEVVSSALSRSDASTD
ncbi:hypothetical protein BDW22DRAFT_476714 [Trametopsis cervina]|nr:hypothetical protein BDW22DRAFT_476714 [Trametopsis cervina]